MSTEMTFPFDKLPAELFLRIGKEIEHNKGKTGDGQGGDSTSSFRDLLKLSSTSRYMRTALSPLVLKRINLGNSNSSIELCRRIAADDLRKTYVKELRFSATAPIRDPHGNDHFSEKELEDVDGCLYKGAEEILSDLSIFPNLKKVIVCFPFGDDHIWSLAHEEDWSRKEDEDETLEFESDEAWRALPAKVFAAIVKNQPGLVKHFEYQRAHPKPVSVWRSDEFAAFLGALESFRIWLGSNNGADWQPNTMDSYKGFTSQLAAAFFTKLTSVTALEITAENAGPIGCTVFHSASYHIPLDSMPKLKRLRLEQVILDDSLRKFLQHRRDALEDVELSNCYSSEMEGSVSWAELFRALEQSSSLRRFSSEPEVTKLDLESGLATEEDQQRIVDFLQAGENRRLFPYADFDDKYGFFAARNDWIVQHFEAGEDQGAWVQLLKTLKKNKQGRR